MTGGNQGEIVDGRFELLDQLGRGGMGTVWRARDTVLHREVALKEVRPADPASAPAGSADARMLRERVLREARALARLSDPHVVTIHHIVDEGPYPWLVMELLPGKSLQDRLPDNPLTPREAARVGREVLGALRTAHAAGIQHRDVKPANVLLRANGSAVLTDFGIAALHGSTTLTATGEFLGSPEFIAPERIRGVDEDPASDLWSLGMTLYVCAEGRSPLRRTTSLATLAAVLDEPLPPPVRSGELGPVLDALLVRDLTLRPDADQLDAMLAEVAEGRAAVPHLPTEPASHQRPAFPAPPQPPPRLPEHAPPGFGPAPNGAVGPAGHPAPPPGGPVYAHPVQPAGQQPTGPIAPGGKGRNGKRTALIACAAFVAATLIAVTAYTLTRTSDDEARGDGGRGGGAPEPAVPTERVPTPDGSPSVQRPAPSTVPDRPPSAPPTPTPGKASPPASDTEPAESWVAQLASVPKSDGTAARTRQHTELSRKTGGVRWLDSDNFSSLKPGYWFFYRNGSDPAGTDGFSSGNAAADWCAGMGLSSSDQCVGRYLSDNREDRVFICAPDKSKGTGRCERD